MYLVYNKLHMNQSKDDKRTEKRKLGDLGEDIACEFLKKRGFEIIEKNYLRKWGEIDIVAKNGTILHFIEVKSVSRNLEGTEKSEGYRAEDNMHPWKLKRLSRVIQTYLLDKMVDIDWQLDLITVKLDLDRRIARAEILENIVI